MQVVLFVGVIALWIPAVCEMSDMYIRVNMRNQKAGRCFQTYRYVETEQGISCVDEQQLNKHQQKMRLYFRRIVLVIRTFLQQACRLIPTKQKFQYHILFTPGYGKKDIYVLYREDIQKILEQICADNGVKITRRKMYVSHIQMRISTSSELNVHQFMKYLKSESTRLLFEKYDTLKYRFEKESFWSKGAYISTTGFEKDKVKRYVRDQGIRDFATNENILKVGNAT